MVFVVVVRETLIAPALVHVDLRAGFNLIHHKLLEACGRYENWNSACTGHRVAPRTFLRPLRNAAELEHVEHPHAAPGPDPSRSAVRAAARWPSGSRRHTATMQRAARGRRCRPSRPTARFCSLFNHQSRCTPDRATWAGSPGSRSCLPREAGPRERGTRARPRGSSSTPCP